MISINKRGIKAGFEPVLDVTPQLLAQLQTELATS